MTPKNRVVKTVDEEADIACLVGRGKLREEVWQESVLVTTWRTGFITGTFGGKLKR